MENKPVNNTQKVPLANKRMGLTLMSIALAFFVAIFLKKILLG
jgi:hypothetical protein